jgi:hypothetical protein
MSETNRRVAWAEQKAAERDALDAALGRGESCPGHETSPNLCRCPCEGCKYHCAAHVPPDATVIGNASVRIRNAEKEQA